MVDTIDPVSTKHGTLISPITTKMCGQVDINPPTALERKAILEPDKPPSGLWLLSPEGASFPVAARPGRGHDPMRME